MTCNPTIFIRRIGSRNNRVDQQIPVLWAQRTAVVTSVSDSIVHHHEIMAAFYQPVDVTKVFSGKLALGEGSDEFRLWSIVSFEIVHCSVRIENTRCTADDLVEKSRTWSPRRISQIRFIGGILPSEIRGWKSMSWFHGSLCSANNCSVRMAPIPSGIPKLKDSSLCSDESSWFSINTKIIC